MAEIEIQKKKPVWPWAILVILIILAILYFFVFDDNEVYDSDMNDAKTEQIDDGTVWKKDNQMDDAERTASWENDGLDYTGAGVSGYVAYIGVKSKMGVDHEYTNKALFYLMDAVREMAENLNIDISNEMEAVRQEAKYITQNWKATDHAESIKNAGTKIVDVLRSMQRKSYPDLAGEVEEVNMAVQAINPDVLTLEQKENILRFFNEAADVLQKMNQ